MVRSAASLIGAHGVHATSLSEVLAASGAPRGSIYHHFPRGKEQLAEEAISWTSDQILAHIAASPPGTPREVLDWFIDLWRGVARASQGRAGCAVAGVAVDTAADVDILGSVRAAFRSWSEALAGRLASAGLPVDESRRVALTTLAAMEGALIICRAEGRAEPLLEVGDELLRLLPDAPRSTAR
jgi:TetR/AcrR family transcriptional regulator, lmrAB and yxaGH operons repressor